jgi:hypothetical protein
MECFDKRELFRARPGIRMILGFVLLNTVISSPTVYGEESRWSFSAGFARRYNIDTDLSSGSSYSAGRYGVGPWTPPPVPGVGSATGYADRDYDDGYVYRDEGTENPAAAFPLATGVTGYYEYQNPAQWNPGADTLTFNKSAATTAANGTSSPFNDEFEDNVNGMQFRLDRILFERDRFRISAVLSAAYFPKTERRLRWSDYTAALETKTVTVTDTYDLQGVDPSVRQNPAPNPTTGFWLWGAPKPGDPPRPVIDNKPSLRTVTLGGTTVIDRYDNEVVYDMDYDLLTVGAGLEFQWMVHKRISLYVSPRIERYRMDINTSREETITDGAGTILNRWDDHADKHEYFWGVVLESGVQVALTDRWFLRVHGDALKTWDSVKVRTGPSEMTMDMSGWSWGCDLGVRF